MKDGPYKETFRVRHAGVDSVPATQTERHQASITNYQTQSEAHNRPFERNEVQSNSQHRAFVANETQHRTFERNEVQFKSQHRSSVLYETQSQLPPKASNSSETQSESKHRAFDSNEAKSKSQRRASVVNATHSEPSKSYETQSESKHRAFESNEAQSKHHHRASVVNETLFESPRKEFKSNEPHSESRQKRVYVYETQSTAPQKVFKSVEIPVESPQKSVKSYESTHTKRSNSKRSTIEEELRSLSTTPRMSHEDYGRIVSPPSEPSSEPPPYNDDMLDDLMEMQMAATRTTHQQNHTNDMMSHMNSQRPRGMMDIQMSNQRSQQTQLTSAVDMVRRDLQHENEQKKLLEKQLDDIDEERKDLNMKLATLRVKLGVANANHNVCKTETDQLRKTNQDTEIKKARLEERINSTTKELERLKDPNNPDSNVNMKKIALSERKEIRRLRQELEAVKSERSETHKRIQDRDSKIQLLKVSLGEVNEEVDSCQNDFDLAKISAVAERTKREEMEEKYNEILLEKTDFDNKMAELQAQLDIAIAGTTGILKQLDEYKTREMNLQEKINLAEKKLRDALTEIEQQKNRDMPIRTASSIKYHQYRMSHNSMVSDTTPHVIITTNPKGSMAASGYLGKSVVQTKPVTSLPSKAGSTSKMASPSKVKTGSLPARK